jgi:hypothetical protein
MIAPAQLERDMPRPNIGVMMNRTIDAATLKINAQTNRTRITPGGGDRADVFAPVWS